MKKNKMMRTASVLLVLTLLTVCVISGTFAKYTTSAEGTDTARVAKFGVTVTANGTTFAKEYNTDDPTATTIAKSVVSTDKVVAPGTSGTMASMALTGTPEVAVKVSYTGDFRLNDKWTVDGNFYCPLTINVAGTAINGTDYNTAAAFEAAVNAAITGYSKEYAAGIDLSGAGNDNLAVSWSWAFAGDDTKDTALGDAAAAGNAGIVTLKVTTTVTQID